jgi:hypothetical protein
MCPQRRARTPTTAVEQELFYAYIRKFFEAPERSAERADVVRKVLMLLKMESREWTERTVRLWFSNNRKHYMRKCLPPPATVIRAAPPPQDDGSVPKVSQERRKAPEIEFLPLPPFLPPR